MKMGLNVTIPDFSSIEQDVMRAVDETLLTMAEEILQDVQDGWTGWKYEGRPAGWRNISRAAWSVRKEVSDRSGMNRAAVILSNDAVDWRYGYYKSIGKSDIAAKYQNRPYVYHPESGRYVARSRGAKPEYLKVIELISRVHIPELERRIVERIVGVVKQAPRTTERPSRFSGSVKRVIQKLKSLFRRS